MLLHDFLAILCQHTLTLKLAEQLITNIVYLVEIFARIPNYSPPPPHNSEILPIDFNEQYRGSYVLHWLFSKILSAAKDASKIRVSLFYWFVKRRLLNYYTGKIFFTSNSRFFYKNYAKTITPLPSLYCHAPPQVARQRY